MLILVVEVSESVEDSSSEVVEVEHSEGSAEEGAEAFGGAVAGAGDKIVLDLVLPACYRTWVLRHPC